MQRRNAIAFFILFIFCIIVLSLTITSVPTIQAVDMTATTIDDMKVLLYIMGEAISNCEPSLTVITTFAPNRSDMNIDRLIEYARDVDPFTGSLLYRVQWESKPYEGNYKVDFKFSYYITTEQYQEIQEFATNYVATLEGLSDYEKVKETHDYLANNCTYNINMNGPYNCLLNKRSNCNGYALSFYLIMKKCDIPCDYVTGYNHAWNTVKLGPFWYNVDVTWDDTNDKLSYDYFLKGRGDWKGHDRNTATAGYEYNRYNAVSNVINTIYYWCRIPFLLVVIYLIYKFIKKKQ